MTANAVPSPAETRLPVLQCVRIRAPSGTSCSPWLAIAALAAASSAAMAWAAASAASKPDGPARQAVSARPVAQARLTAVGRAALRAAAAAGTSSPRAAASATP